MDVVIDLKNEDEQEQEVSIIRKKKMNFSELTKNLLLIFQQLQEKKRFFQKYTRLGVFELLSNLDLVRSNSTNLFTPC